ncbi:hypothetical protein ASG21_14350 [Chryseobacterium sp. Leaf394]|nr:hypothetical protein ASG21_14350 [Chryseobacterium sp. Leaf394]
MKNFGGQGSSLLFIIDFFGFAILYIVSTAVFYLKKSKISGFIVPVVIFGLYIIEFFLQSEWSADFWKSFLLAIFTAFFPIYIFNYFRVLYWYFNPERK